MSIWDRLGSVVNSYFNDFGYQTASRFRSSGDPDLNAAFEELNDFLSGSQKTQTRYTGYGNRTSGRDKLPPEELRVDFEKLGVPFGADLETCKAAYKNLQKIHHPDRHAGHEGNYKKATERSARITASWERIQKWSANESK